ncbi:hypothetical protein [Rhizobium anhuiense]|uniref:Uncharacterized protein n=1 Tax=Rhizobium anhuiense TaxID=1184720 RepID=A0A3S0SRK1_9HYPH|nr:hypothetical protein [Rhizobium anhuiense]RUL98553.1 hypothetical protein EEQ99_24070 [Rhizobium anhuiense]GGD97857.1 hypothetical protein GCM10008012_46880 [Rhizobium anhuiense]
MALRSVKFTTRSFPHNSNRSVEIFLGTMNVSEYLNMGVGGSTQTLHPEDAKRLRDELIAIYPLEVPAAATKPTKFKVGDKVTYKAIVGYGARGMDGRKGSVKEVLANGWYMVNFTGGPFDNLIKTHEDYLVAGPREIQVGDLVRRTGANWRDVKHGEIYTVSAVGSSLKLVGLTGSYTKSSFELVHTDPVEAVKAAVPTIQSGRFIVAKLEGARYLPGTNPKVHVTDIGAEAEALRLAKEHGGTYHVFKATYEASRELPVIPPVKTTKL